MRKVLTEQRRSVKMVNMMNNTTTKEQAAAAIFEKNKHVISPVIERKFKMYLEAEAAHEAKRGFGAEAWKAMRLSERRYKALHKLLKAGNTFVYPYAYDVFPFLDEWKRRVAK